MEEPDMTCQVPCSDGSSHRCPASMADVVVRIAPAAALWGFGTGLGMLPPFVIARSASHTTSGPVAESNASSRVPRWARRLLEDYGVAAVYALAIMFPKPVFQIVGALCGSTGAMSQGTFAGGAILGKASKALAQAVFLVAWFRDHERLVRATASFVTSVTGGVLVDARVLEDKLNFALEGIASVHPGEHGEAGPGTAKFWFRAAVLGMVVLFLWRMAQRLARAQLERQRAAAPLPPSSTIVARFNLKREFCVNSLGQPVGPPLPEHWKPPPHPQEFGRTTIRGRFVQLKPLTKELSSSTRVRDELLEAFQPKVQPGLWTWLPFEPPGSQDGASAEEDMARVLRYMACHEEPPQQPPSLVAFVVQAAAEPHESLGYISLLRIAPEHASVEIGHVTFSPRMTRSPYSTEAQFLLMNLVFEHGYRRLEWKCDSLNEPSSRAALRLGYRFEGVFRRAVVTKGRSRDTAWFALMDDEWNDTVKPAFEAWFAGVRRGEGEGDGNGDAPWVQETSLTEEIERRRN